MTANKSFIVSIEATDTTGECFIRIPDELLEVFDWNEGDDILIEDTMMCEEWGEHDGLTLSNLTKNPPPEMKDEND